jgi:hypothetical protein
VDGESCHLPGDHAILQAAGGKSGGFQYVYCRYTVFINPHAFFSLCQLAVSYFESQQVLLIHNDISFTF